MDNSGFYVLIAFGIGWIIAQASKMIILAIKDKKQGFKALMAGVLRSGGMPSGHTASLTAACMYLLLRYGVFSMSFVTMFCVTVIVIYDAMNVRFAVGEQGKALKRLSQDVKIVEGHTPPEVLVGLLIGIATGAFVWGIELAGMVPFAV